MKGNWDKIPKFKNLETGQVKILKTSNDKVFTVLGSCVSVIFFVPKLMSLICHAQLPTQSKYEFISSGSGTLPSFKNGVDSLDLMYVDCSVDYMVNVLLKNKINFKGIHTTVLGGASVFGNLNSTNSIGNQNIAVAKNILAKYHIKINRELIGGDKGLTIWYYAGSNKLIVNRHTENIRFELNDVHYPSFLT